MFPPRRRCFRRQTCKNTTSCLSQRPREGVRLLGGVGGVSARLRILRCQLAFQKFLLTCGSFSCRFYGMLKREDFSSIQTQHSYSSKSHYGRFTTLHRVSAFYLDNISPGNVKNVSSIKSNDICFKCSFLFSFFFSWKRVHLIVWGKGCVMSACEPYKDVREVRRQRQ